MPSGGNTQSCWKETTDPDANWKASAFAHQMLVHTMFLPSIGPTCILAPRSNRGSPTGRRHRSVKTKRSTPMEEAIDARIARPAGLP